MTTTEAAAALGVTIGRIQQLIYAQRLEARKIGRDWHVTPESVDAMRVRPRVGRPRATPTWRATHGGSVVGSGTGPISIATHPEVQA